jgi:ATP-dependent RNA helicase HelY
MYKWAKGTRLDDVLFDADMPAGDFVRWAKQTIDLLDQLAQVTTGSLQTTSRIALDHVRRGIVAYSTVI